MGTGRVERLDYAERWLRDGLRVIDPPGGLEKYYRDNVIGGAGSFVIVAENFETFGRAIVKKMIAEIAGNERPRRRLAPGPAELGGQRSITNPGLQ